MERTELFNTYLNIGILCKLCRCVHHEVCVAYLDGCLWMIDLSHILLRVKYVSGDISEALYIITIILTILQIDLYLREQTCTNYKTKRFSQ